MVHPQGDTTIPQFAIGDLVEVRGTKIFWKIIGVFMEEGLEMYWLKSLVSNKFVTQQVSELRKLP